MIGLFINSIPVRVRWEEKMKFFQLLQKIQAEAIESEAHHHCPLVEIQAISLVKRNLFDHNVGFENYPIAKRIEGYENEDNESNKPGLKLTHVEVFEQSNYDFNVAVSAAANISISFLYNGNVYERDDVERIGSHFRLIADQVIENQDIEINDIELLSAEEKKRILQDFKNTHVEYPKDKNLRGLFQQQEAEENKEFTGDFGFN